MFSRDHKVHFKSKGSHRCILGNCKKNQAAITTNTSHAIIVQQNNARLVPVHDLSGYRVILVHQLVPVFAPVVAWAMSTRMPLKSDNLSDQVNIAWVLPGNLAITAR
jgi:hypothetical protein